MIAKKIVIGVVSLIAAVAGLFWVSHTLVEKQSTLSPANRECSDDVVILQEVVHFCGLVTSEKVEIVESIDADAIKKIVVKSRGGDPLPAIKLANKIDRSGWELEIRGLCLSACAHFVLPATGRARIAPGTLIAFHHTSTAISRVFSVVLPTQQDRYRERRGAEEDYYRSKGIDIDFLSKPFSDLQKARMGFDLLADEAEFASVEYDGHNFVAYDLSMLASVLSITLSADTIIPNHVPSNVAVSISESDGVIFSELNISKLSSSAKSNLQKVCVGTHIRLDEHGMILAFKPRQCFEPTEK